MSDEEFAAYRERLGSFVFSYIEEVEAETKRSFDVFIAHHAFLNPMVMNDVNDRREAAGKARVPLFTFVHGTSLLMFKHEMAAVDPEYPPRFYPAWISEGVFDQVAGVFVISNSQKERFLSVFDSFDPANIFITPNGIDPSVFKQLPLEADSVLAEFETTPYEGSKNQSKQLPGGWDRIVLFVGKFADIKRIDCLLNAAQTYEKVAKDEGLTVATIIAGSGPHESVKLYQDLSDELGLEEVYFIGPHQQDNLAKLYNIASLGVFPTKIEGFGLVFLECLACGTPVVGNAAGGPLEFVDPTVGELVFDHESNQDFTVALAETISRALVEDWKQTKSEAAIERASNYTIEMQCKQILQGIESLT